MQPAIICLMGPTASGKTDLAIALAEQIKGELISVDSALVYRGLDIGSAKPTYPHHLINLRDPAEPYNVANFVRDIDQVITDVINRGATPILVGGTMMYFKAFLDGLSPMPSSDPSVREQIEQEARERGWPACMRSWVRWIPSPPLRFILSIPAASPEHSKYFAPVVHP